MKKIVIENVTKKFKNELVLDNVSVSFNSGKIIGIVGVNGSGKTVLLRLISGLMKPTTGSIYIDDKKMHKDLDFPESIGVVIEKPAFFEEFTGYKNLQILRDIKKIISDEEVLHYLSLVGLKNDNKPVSKYSVGMKQRLAFAQSIMESPELLVLDEFTSGIDEDGIDMMFDIIRAYKDENRLIILSSHHREDIDSLCDEVYKISKGKIERIR